MLDATTAATPSDVFRDRLREAREARPMSQRQLAAALTDIGVPMSQAAVTRIETGLRNVTLDEVIGIAVVLDVAPMNLFLPIDGDEHDPVPLAQQVAAEFGLARRWARGESPLRQQDVRFYFSQAPHVRVTPADLARMTDEELAQAGVVRQPREEEQR